MNSSATTENIIDLRLRFEPRTHWFSLQEGYRAPITRDHRLNIIRPFTQYGIWKAQSLLTARLRPSAHKSHIDRTASAMREFACFLAKKNKKWDAVDQAMLAEYRDWALEERKSRGNYKNELTAKATTNAYLKVIYQFLLWAQDTAFLGTNLIGETGCRVRSALGSKGAVSSDRKKYDRFKYPLLYRGIGEKAAHSSQKHWPTQAQFDEVKEYFYSNNLPHIARRNVLIMDVVDAVAWRRSSVQSLTTRDFTGRLQESESRAGVMIAPSFQKLGYELPFEVSYELLLAIQSYISDERKSIVDRYANKCDALFLSDTTGEALSLTAITDIFAAAFKAIGVDVPNASIQSIRRKSAQDLVDSIVEHRKEHKLPITEQDIQLEMKRHLGHASRLSSEAYRRRESKAFNESSGAQKQRTILAKDAENFVLRRENERLRAELQLQSNTPHKDNPPKATPIVAKKKR